LHERGCVKAPSLPCAFPCKKARPLCRSGLHDAPVIGTNAAQATGVEFPEVVDLWPGEKFRCLGAGNRQKKIAFVGVKVSSLTSTPFSAIALAHI